VHLLILPALAWLGACMLRWRWKPAAIAFVPALFFIGSYGIMFLPRSVSAAPDEPHLKILTYNIHSEQTSFAPMIALIRESGTDVVAIQELTTEAAARFKTELADQYPYQAFHAEPNTKYIGQGILSRFPILNDVYWRNVSLQKTLGHERAQIDANGITFTLYNTHPIHPISAEGLYWYPERRTAEIKSVLERAQHDSGPIIIVGDFNMTDQSDDYKLITSHYLDTYREVGWGLGFTFPDFTFASASPVPHNLLPLRPVVRLDYLFHNTSIQALDAHVWNSSGGSDHRPVFAEFAFVDDPR